MPLVRRRRPLLRATAIACGAYSAGRRRRQGPQDRDLDPVAPARRLSRLKPPEHPRYARPKGLSSARTSGWRWL